MKNLLHTQLLMVLIIVLCAIIIIAATWGIALDGNSPVSVVSTPSDGTSSFEEGSSTADTASSSQTASTDSSQTESSTTETTSGKIEPPKTPTKKIALTFDDGPHNTYTHKILNLLEEYGAKATFFVLGCELDNSTADELKRAISLGCEIGNHSESHSYLTSASDAKILEEIRSTNEKIAKYSGINYECKLLRPPYGSIDRDVMEVLMENGEEMHCILWSSDSRDWEFKSDYYSGKITRDEAVQSAFDIVCNETEDGTVILMHDIQEITPDILALILEKYSAEGYEFVTISELFGFDEMTDEDSYYYRYRSTDSILTMS